MKTIDLHVHSTASDGTVSPADLVAMAAALPLCAFALTDHDTTDGIDKARKAALSVPGAPEVIPGILSRSCVSIISCLSAAKSP